jgi:hypothetical protein
MTVKQRSWRRLCAAGGLFTVLLAAVALVTVALRHSEASIFNCWWCRHECDGQACGCPGHVELSGEPGGRFYWLRSPEEEKRVIMGLYNRYCIRCHGVDGRGVWDIPDVPDFTNARWQACRSDGQLARAILEGRGAVMPPFRGTLTLEEAWAMAHYLRTFVPGTETSRPDAGQSQKPAAAPQAPAPKKVEELPPPK